jgi:hypothetical protein
MVPPAGLAKYYRVSVSLSDSEAETVAVADSVAYAR